MTLPSLPVWFVAILCATFMLYCGADTVSVNGTNGTLFEVGLSQNDTSNRDYYCEYKITNKVQILISCSGNTRCGSFILDLYYMRLILITSFQFENCLDKFISVSVLS